MIQDIYPHTFDNHFKPGQVPADEDILFAFSGESVLCRQTDSGVEFPSACGGEPVIYLFSEDSRRFFLAEEDSTVKIDDFEYTPLRALRKKDTAQKPLIFAAITARHLNDWYGSNRFCGRCGAKTQRAPAERTLVCPNCSKVLYPRINPAVIVGVISGDRLLLTKYAGRGMSFYALVAGFTEIGETFEETVKREVMEETGLHVTNIRYYKSQPWGFSGDILAGYFCDLDGDPAIHIDTHELKEAVWMPRDRVPGQPDDFSLTNEMMLAFHNGYGEEE